ncbi:MAG: hypothetical protein AAGA99_26290 [Actinomycetota bacterium]
MSRRYAQLQTTIWADPDFAALPAGAQLLYLKLLSEPQLSHAGVCGLTERRWARSTADHDRADVEVALSALEAARFVVVDEDTEEVLVRSLVRHGSMLSAPKRIDGVEQAVRLIASDELRLVVLTELRRAAEEAIATGVQDATRDRLSELLETISETIPETVSDTTPTGSLSSPSPSSSPSQSVLQREQESSTSTRRGPGRAEPPDLEPEDLRAESRRIAEAVLARRQHAGLHTPGRGAVTLGGIAHSLLSEGMPAHEIEDALTEARVPTKPAVISIVNAKRQADGVAPFEPFDPEEFS